MDYSVLVKKKDTKKAVTIKFQELQSRLQNPDEQEPKYLE